MKKAILSLGFLCLGYMVCAQPKKAQEIFKKASVYYEKKQYKTAALTYSKGLAVSQGKAVEREYLLAAYCWAKAGNADSAFALLNYLIKHREFAYYDELLKDPSLEVLHADIRWKKVLVAVKENHRVKEAKLNRPLMALLDTILKADQCYRMQMDSIGAKFGQKSPQWTLVMNSMDRADSINLLRVEKILDRFGWLGTDIVGREGNSTLFLVIQHADLKTQEKYLPVLREAVKNNAAGPDALAYFEDRVALGQGKKQVYGSQVLRDEKTGKCRFAPLADSIHVNARREEVGLGPLEDYARSFGIEMGTKKKTANKVQSAGHNADFETAMEIKDSIVGPLQVCNGFGERMEFACGRGLECKESNSSWFTFAIRKDALLTFDIVPLDPMDDYDFILFKCSSPDCIKGIQSGEVMPDRMCFTQDHTLQGATGLSTYAAYSILYSGPGPSYVAALPVKAGEQYYLMVDNYHYSSKGFKIYFYGLAPAKTKEQVKKVLLKRRAEAVVLENVWFESNKSVLISESDAALTKLAKVLENSQDIHIEIQGYTDNTGNESENVNLSLARAKAVKAYLLKKNIAPQRLHCKGLGSSNPKADNATAEGQKKNRRVEVKVWDDKD